MPVKAQYQNFVEIIMAYAPPNSRNAFHVGTVLCPFEIGTPTYNDMTTGTRHMNSDLDTA
jgi:hypothetical protein